MLLALSISFLLQTLYYSSLERIHAEENLQQRETNSVKCVAHHVISKGIWFEVDVYNFSHYSLPILNCTKSKQYFS